ncbi:MAG: DUF935 domain-containing protein [Gammaproteobacteria bacterium]|nr:MAG: DUF935 domain-containing protein [Gammaproteobacteria bacterium]
MTVLYDAHGQKIDLGALRREESAPSLRSVRQPFSGHPSHGLTPGRLAAILRQADDGDPFAQCELFEDIEEKDSHLASVLGMRRRAVAALEVRVVPPRGANRREKKAAELAGEVLEAIPGMPERVQEILDAIGKGYSVSEIIWEISGQQAWVRDLRWRDPKWFRFDPDTLSEIRLRDLQHADGMPLTPYKYVTHVHKAKAGLPVRGGILRPCAWMYLFKNYDIKDWVTFAEVYGQPLRVGKHPATASEAEKDTLLRAVANLGTDASAIIPESMLIEFVEAGGKSGSVDLYERLARWCDEQMSKAVLGQTSSADAMSHGLGSGQANLHAEVRDDLIESDARQLAATLSRDLVRPIVDLNMGPMDRYPAVVIELADEEDLDQLAANIDRLARLGLPIPAQWAYDRFGIPAPKEGEPVLAPSAPAAPDLAANAQISVCNQISADAVDHLAGRMEREAEPITDAMIAQARKLLDEVNSLEEFADRLPELCGSMDTEKLGELMAKALAAADLAGQYEVTRGE